MCRYSDEDGIVCERMEKTLDGALESADRAWNRHHRKGAPNGDGSPIAFDVQHGRTGSTTPFKRACTDAVA